MGVGTLSHRGASMHHRAVMPIVFFAMMFGLGGTGSLSHRVSKSSWVAAEPGSSEGAAEVVAGVGQIFKMEQQKNRQRRSERSMCRQEKVV